MKRINWPKQLIIIFLLLFFRLNNLNADDIQYSYDASGNRIRGLREILMREDYNSEKDQRQIQDNLANHHITIYPNPTDGMLQVEIAAIEKISDSSVIIYDTTGNQIYYQDQLENINEINLSVCPDGFYMLIIRIDDQSSIWKIIKK